MKIESRLGKTLVVHLVLLAYWFPALIADTVLQCPTVDGVHIFTDYATNWCLVLILVHLITAIGRFQTSFSIFQIDSCSW